MKSPLLIIILALCLGVPPAEAQQEGRLPRDAEKLITRAKTFWASQVSGRRTAALDLVLPDKRDAFISGSVMPIISAEVVGVDLTADPNRASVRVRAQMLSVETPGGRLDWSLTSNWVWRGGNWFVDIGDPRSLLALSRESSGGADIEQIRREIESSLTIPEPAIDWGMLVQGIQVRSELPIQYTGKLPLTVEPVVPADFIAIVADNGVLTPESTRLTVLLNTTSLDGPMSIPFRVRFRYEAAEVERTIQLRGDVFVPITFRQVPAAGPFNDGDQISVFIRNNTAEAIPLLYISVDAKLDVLKDVPVLAPGQETEAIFRVKRGSPPENVVLSLMPKAPVMGLQQFGFSFQTGP